MAGARARVASPLQVPLASSSKEVKRLTVQGAGRGAEMQRNGEVQGVRLKGSALDDCQTYARPGGFLLFTRGDADNTANNDVEHKHVKHVSSQVLVAMTGAVPNH